LTYNPTNFTASNGTVVKFLFPSQSGSKRNQVAHSVTQGSFEKPCVYLAAAGGKPPGFDSGLQSSGQFSLEVTNDQERMQKIFVLSSLLSFIDLQIRTQPSGSSANSISIAAKEWSARSILRQQGKKHMMRT
jgi:hypothetical protein